ncbi:MAG: hypothetical protein M3389_04970, partial [Actinomycetota bacterium]|nr:hypothetical protein [Actinomycetota bacterium]
MPSAIDADHPLHSMLSGFSEPADDVLADLELEDDATVEFRPPRHPSAGRPLDDDPSDDEPFTPPIPVGTLHRCAPAPPSPAPGAASSRR